MIENFKTSDASCGNKFPSGPTLSVNTADGHLLLTKPEVATRLRKTTRTIDTYMTRGILPYFKIGRSVLFNWTDVQRHLDKHFRISRFSDTADRSGGVQ